MNRALALVVLAGALARFYGLGHESLWYDEAVSRFNADMPLAHVPSAVAARDVSPPLYFLALSLWIKLFGVGEAALRSLSAVGSTVALVFFHRVAEREAGARTALIAAVLFACAPFSIRFAQEARMYGLLLPLAWIAFDALSRALRDPEPRFGLFAAISLALLYTHAFGAFVPLCGLAAALALRGPRVALSLVWWLIPVGLAFLPWALVMLAQAKARAGGFWIGVPDLKSIHYLIYVMAGGSPDARDVASVELASRALARVAYGLAAAALAVAWWRRRADPVAWRALRLALAGLWLPVALVFVVSRLGTPLFVDRYFLFAAPFFWLWLALGLALIPGRWCWLGLAFYVALELPVLADHYARPHKEQWREAVAAAYASGAPADLIVDTGGMMVLMMYLKPGHPPQTSTAGSGFPQVDLPPERLPELLHGAKNVWVFYSPYAREPARYREAMRRTHDEVAYTKLHGLAVGCYRSR